VQAAIKRSRQAQQRAVGARIAAALVCAVATDHPSAIAFLFLIYAIIDFIADYYI